MLCAGMDVQIKKKNFSRKIYCVMFREVKWFILSSHYGTFHLRHLRRCSLSQGRLKRQEEKKSSNSYFQWQVAGKTSSVTLCHPNVPCFIIYRAVFYFQRGNMFKLREKKQEVIFFSN